METDEKTLGDRIQLGASGLQVSRIGVGTNRWGSTNQADPALLSTFEAALNTGINLFDTAEMYTLGGSEKTLGLFLGQAAQPAVVTTKFFPAPWRLTGSNLKKALRASLARLNLKAVDLYLMHWPFGPLAIETWMEAMAEAYADGLLRAVGVSNFSAEQMHRAHTVLVKHGIPLACNQVEYNLFNRQAETSGLLSLCRELNITLVAYRPFAGGILSGKFTPENPARGLRALMYNRFDPALVQSITALLGQIGAAHGGKSMSQVALNWLICKGALPIPGATSPAHIAQNAGALGWSLAEGEIAALDSASTKRK
jgi:aryl-alcohol dehydrogenase-like predicted oxidoreductase